MPLQYLPQQRESQRQHRTDLPHVVTFVMPFMIGVSMDLKREKILLYSSVIEEGDVI